MARFEQDFLDDYSDAGLLDEIRRVAGLTQGQSLTMQLFDQHARVHSSTVHRRFGGWSKAIEAAGLARLRSEKLTLMTSTNREGKHDLYLQVLKRAANATGKQYLTQHAFNSQRAVGRGPTGRTIVKFFGSWQNALRTAGLPSREHREPTGFSKDDCLNNLSTLCTAAKRIPTYADLQRRPSRMGPKAYERHWGTFTKALSEWVKIGNSSAVFHG